MSFSQHIQKLAAKLQAQSPYWLPIGLFVLGLLFRFFWVEARDLCIDEPFSVYHAQKSPMEIVRFSVSTEPNPPLYMLLLHFVMQLFGDSVTSVRALSIIFSSATAVLLFSIAKKYSTISGGLIAWILFSFSTSHFIYGSEARAYPLFRLEYMLLIWSWIKLQEQPENKKTWIIHTLVSIALLYTHYLGALVLAVSGGLTLALNPARFFSFRIIKSYFLAGLLWLPLLIPAWHVIYHRGENSVHQLPNFIFFKYQLVSVWNGGANYGRFMLIFFCCLSLMLFSKKVREMFPLYVPLLGLLCYVVLYFGSRWVWFFSDTYLLFTTLTFYLTLGIFGGRAIKSFPKISVIPLVILLLFYLQQFKPNPKNIVYREVKKTVEAVQNLRKNNEPVFLIPPWTVLPFSYYAYPDIFKLTERDFEAALYKNKLFKIEKTSEIEIRLAGATSFILYLDEYRGVNTIGELPKGFYVKDSLLIPEVYLVLYCELDSNLFTTLRLDTVLN